MENSLKSSEKLVQTSNRQVRRMTLEDVDAVHEIEVRCFSTPWSKESFVQELSTNKLARYMVLELDGKIVAYGGFWIVVDEAHITNIAVDPSMRRLGLGKTLVQGMIDEIRKTDLYNVTLEVRASNTPAYKLYAGFGFVEVGRRPGYYQSPKEDAVIMWLKLV